MKGGVTGALVLLTFSRVCLLAVGGTPCPLSLTTQTFR